MTRTLTLHAAEYEARSLDLARSVACAGCGAPMAWVQTRTGARMPLSLKTARPAPCPDCIPDGPPEVCGACGCTDEDCTACVARTGKPCTWSAPGLCSACLELGPPTPRRCARCSSTGVVFAVLSHFADCPKASRFSRKGRR